MNIPVLVDTHIHPVTYLEIQHTVDGNVVTFHHYDQQTNILLNSICVFPVEWDTITEYVLHEVTTYTLLRAAGYNPIYTLWHMRTDSPQTIFDALVSAPNAYIKSVHPS